MGGTMEIYEITLVIGDWSGDGHEMTQRIAYVTNRPRGAIEKAYRMGTKEIGFDLSEECKAYQNDLLEVSRAKTLNDAGWKWKDQVGSALFSMTPEMFADAWMFIAKLGDSNLCYELIKPSTINIGGYGLLGTIY
jgi:hypothetical protein